MGFKCKFYKAKDADEYEYAKTTGTSCGNCLRWDGACMDKDKVDAYYAKELDKWNRAMKGNKRVWLE